MRALSSSLFLWKCTLFICICVCSTADTIPLPTVSGWQNIDSIDYIGGRLPSFGTAPHAIYYNGASTSVNLTTMFSAKPRPHTCHAHNECKYKWYVLVAKLEDSDERAWNDLGRANPWVIEEALWTIVAREIGDEYTPPQGEDLHVEPPIQTSEYTIKTIIPIMDIHWLTLRLEVPPEFTIWVTSYPRFESVEDQNLLHYWIMAMEVL